MTGFCQTLLSGSSSDTKNINSLSLGWNYDDQQTSLTALCCSWRFSEAPAFFCSCFIVVTGKIMSLFWTHCSISSPFCSQLKIKQSHSRPRSRRLQPHFNRSILLVNKHSNVSVIKLSRSSHLNTSAQLEYDAFDFSSGARSLGKF